MHESVIFTRSFPWNRVYDKGFNLKRPLKLGKNWAILTQNIAKTSSTGHSPAAESAHKCIEEPVTGVRI